MCTREELEAHFQAAKEFCLVKRALTALRKQGLSAGKAYQEVLSSHNNPLLLRYYAPSLYAHAMTIPLEPVQREETSPLHQQPAQELQEEATATPLRVSEFSPGEESQAQFSNPNLSSSLREKLLKMAQRREKKLRSSDGPVPAVTFDYRRNVAGNGNGASPQATLPMQPHAQEHRCFVVLGSDVETQEDITLPDSERSSGVYIVGVAGAGKSTVLGNIAVTDANNGHGVFVIDVQGDLIDDILARLPGDRLADVILLDPGSGSNPFGMNILAHSDKGVDHDVDLALSVPKRLWGVGTDQPFWGPRLETLLRNGLYVLWYNDLTLAELPILLRNKDFRAACLKNVPPDGRWVTFFFEHDFNNLSTYLQMEHSESTLNKIYQLLTIREVEYVISQQTTTIDFRHLMDERKIVLLKLPKHAIGEDAVKFLGTIIFSELLEAARSRADVASEDRPFFSVIIDEFQNFNTPLFSQMLPELRKYHLSFTLAHQFLAQLDEENRGATQQLANQMTCRVRPRDAETLAHFYAKQPTVEYREQEKKTPVTRPINWLVGGGRSHQDQIVTAFAAKWEDVVREANIHLREGTSGGSTKFVTDWRGRTKAIHTPAYFYSNRGTVEYIRKGLELINGLLYEVMLTKNAYQVAPLELVQWMAEEFELPFFDLKRYQEMTALLAKFQPPLMPIDDYFDRFCIARFCDGSCGKIHKQADEYKHTYFVSEQDKKAQAFYPLCDYITWLFETFTFGAVHTPTEEQVALYQNLWLVPDDSFEQALTAFADEARKHFLQAMQGVLMVFRETVGLEYHTSENGNQGQPMLKRYNFADHESLRKDVFVVDGAFDASNQWDDLNKALKRFSLDWFPPEVVNTFQWEQGTIHKDPWGEKYAYDTAGWRLVAGQENEWLTLPAVREAIDRIFAEQREAFEAFVKELRTVMQALATSPILDRSGEHEMVEVRRRSIADMVNDMAQELIHLPNREAYVKLGVSGAESVKIQTLPLEPGCSPEELETRKRIITENTLPYTSKRDEVEQELQQRHAAYTTGKKPQPQAQPQPQPQQQETIPQPQPAKEETQSRSPLRRVSAASDTNPLQHSVVFTDEKTTADTYLTLLYYFSHLTLQQAVRLTGKQTSINNERTKLNKLVKDGLVISEPMKESVSSGRAPLAYSVTPKGYKYLETEKGLSPLKKGDYSLHSYLVNEMLITAILAAKNNDTVKLVGFEHEKMFRMKPIQLPNGKGVEPDGLLIYQAGQVVAPIAFEVDLSIETRDQLLDKVQKYLQALQGPYEERCRVDAISIAFITPNGSDNDVARLHGIIETALETHKQASSLFFVGAFDPLNIAPLDVLFAPIFTQPFGAEKHALIEKPS